VAGQIGIGGIEIRLVAVGLGHPTAQVVRDRQFRDPAEEGKGAHVRADPVGELLHPGGLGVGEVGSPQDGHEDLGRADLAGASIHDFDRLSGIVCPNGFSPARCSWRITTSSFADQARYWSQNQLYW